MTHRDSEPKPEAASGALVPDSVDTEPSVRADSEESNAAGPASSAVEAVSALTRYMADLRKHPPITREEERALAIRWFEEKDVDAARQMVLSNLRLVVKIAMEYRRAWTNTLDLVQEGNVGLMEAVQRFDPYHDVKLSSYAVYWIRAYILKYILDNMRSTRMGTTRAERKLFFRLNKEKRALEGQGFEIEPRLLAERLDVTEDDVIEMEARLSQPDISLSTPSLRGEGDATYGDFIPAKGSNAEEQVGGGQLRALFMEQIEGFSEDLEERDRKILEERVLSEDPRTLSELGKEFGVSRERVRQLEVKLIDRLREHVKARMVDFDYYAPPSE